jgi:hypothetical protein
MSQTLQRVSEANRTAWLRYGFLCFERRGMGQRISSGDIRICCVSSKFVAPKMHKGCVLMKKVFPIAYSVKGTGEL